MMETQNSSAASDEEKTTSIRFLEKENLQLMMEAKELRGKLTKVGVKHDMAPSNPEAWLIAHDDFNSHPSQLQAEVEVFRASHAAMSSSASTGPGTERPYGDLNKGSARKKPVGFQVPAVDKENQCVGGMPVDHGETAPPFRSLNEDDTLQANQCRQS